MTERLSTATKTAFGIGAMGEAAISIVFNSFNFLFYNNVLGLSGTLCGLAVTISMVFDAFSDPFVGALSDRWRSRFGRRHPFMYGAAIPMGLFFVAIYAPPATLEGLGLFAWFTASTVLFRTAQTFYHVPHLALGAEMTKDYGERSVLMSYNTFFALMRTSGVSSLSWSYIGTLDTGTSDPAAYLVIASSAGLLAALVVLLSAYFTRDQVERLSKAPDNLPKAGLGTLMGELRSCLENHNYKVLLLGMIFLAATMGMHETLSSHISLFFFELREDQIKFLALGAGPGLILAAVVTPKLHVWFGKRETLMAGILGMATSVAGPIVLRLFGWFPDNGSHSLFLILCAAKAFSYAASTTMVISLVSTLGDVTDEHELQSGRRQEGAFFASRSFFSKLTSGLGHLLAGLAIDVIDFPVGVRSGEIDAETLYDFGVVAGPLSVLPAFISLLFYSRYRIDKKRHVEILAELEATRERGATTSESGGS